MRFRAAKHLGWETIPAILVDIPEQLARERALRDNGSWGEWEEDDLAALLAEFGAAGSELELLGFDERELQQLLDSLGKEPGLTDPDDVPPLPEEPLELLQTTPWELFAEVNRLARLGDATNHEITWYALWLLARLDAVRARLGMVDCLRLWGLHADQLRRSLLVPEAAARQSKRSRAGREGIEELLGRAPSLFPLDGEQDEEEIGVDALGRKLVRIVAREAKATWAELLALDKVVSEAAAQFDGEEPILPETRQMLEGAKAAVTVLQEALSPWFEDLVLPEEPDEQVVRALTADIERRSERT